MKSRKALIIEDEQVWSSFLHEILEEQGLLADSATSYKQAIDRLIRESYLLATLDINLEGRPRNRDGLRLLKFLHLAQSDWESVPQEALAELAEGLGTPDSGVPAGKSELLDVFERAGALNRDLRVIVIRGQSSLGRQSVKEIVQQNYPSVPIFSKDDFEQEEEEFIDMVASIAAQQNTSISL